MKIGFMHCPTLQDLEKAYHVIFQTNGKAMNLNTFSQFCQWTRFDSRLGEICVQFLSKHWETIHPLELRTAFLQSPWPAVLGVLLEFCFKKDLFFKHWKKLATFEIKKANGEQFFIGKRKIAGSLMLDDVRFSLEEYRRWGYFGREVLVNKQNESTQPHLAYSTRIEILKELLKTHPKIKTRHYWEAVGKCISIRQAERDLRNFPHLKSCGHTKGKFFILFNPFKKI